MPFFKNLSPLYFLEFCIPCQDQFLFFINFIFLHSKINFLDLKKI